MQHDSKILYEAISRVINNSRLEQDIGYTDFCYENGISMSTYDNVINAATQSSFYNISKMAFALNMNFETFGRLLDKELPPNFKFLEKED